MDGENGTAEVSGGDRPADARREAGKSLCGNKHRRSGNVCDDNSVISCTATHIGGVEMCVMITASFPVQQQNNRKEKTCVMTIIDYMV